MKYYDKLVRDRIPEIIESTGKKCDVETVDKTSAIHYLIHKFSEEIKEFEEDHSIEELADILEIIHGLAHHLDIDWTDLEKTRKDKNRARGAFEKGFVLKSVWE